MLTLHIKCEDICICGGSFEIPNGLYFQRIKYNVTPCIHKNPINKTGIAQSYLFDFILSLNINAIKVWLFYGNIKKHGTTVCNKERTIS